jgi:hypothetical protein
MIYVICGRDYHSLELAFSSRADAERWVRERMGEGRYDIVPVQLSNYNMQEV